METGHIAQVPATDNRTRPFVARKLIELLNKVICKEELDGPSKLEQRGNRETIQYPDDTKAGPMAPNLMIVLEPSI